jgi:hypothetical protein
MVGDDEPVKPEWISRDGRIHDSAPGCVHFERLAPTAIAHLVLLVTAHEVVFVGVHRKKDPESPFGIDMQDDEISVILGSHLDLGSITRKEPAIIADPDLDRGVVPGYRRSTGGSLGEEQRKEQRGYHSTSQTTSVTSWKI